jgi:hypothetical protein
MIMWRWMCFAALLFGCNGDPVYYSDDAILHAALIRASDMLNEAGAPVPAVAHGGDTRVRWEDYSGRCAHTRVGAYGVPKGIYVSRDVGGDDCSIYVPSGSCEHLAPQDVVSSTGFTCWKIAEPEFQLSIILAHETLHARPALLADGGQLGDLMYPSHYVVFPLSIQSQ